MKVLLINQIGDHQTPLLTDLCNHVLMHGVETDLFNFQLGLFYSPTGGNTPLSFWTYKLLLGLSFRAFLKRWLWKYVLPHIVSRMAEPYDAIDFQGLFSKYAMALVPMMKRQGKNVKITIWGSDFYRQVGGSWEEKEECFNNSDIIAIATSQMYEDFIKVYPQFKNKMRIVRFGLSQLDKLKERLSSHEIVNASFLEIPKGKIVITCGYNGIPTQQHLKMIEAFSIIPQEMKDLLYLLFPMTYGLSIDYLHSVETALKDIGIGYKIITKQLSLDNLLTLRIMTNITLNIQVSDAMSASIQEHLMAGNLVIVGDWLPYSIYDGEGVFLRRTSLEELTTNIMWAVKNYQSLKNVLKDNAEKIYHLSSWQHIGERQTAIYKELEHRG